MSKLQERYIQIVKDARWMDIVGDYAGDELFIIDGESLLQTVLDDELLAIGRSTGCDFQAAHALYILEAILENFTSRQARFEIVFFQLTIPATTLPGSEPFVYRSRDLARLLLQKHLHMVDIPVHYFENLQDPAWIEHERLEKPMLVLAKDSCKIPQNIDENSRSYTRLLQRQILDYLAFGLSVGILNGIEFRDSKILTFILEPSENTESSEEGPTDDANSPLACVNAQVQPSIDRDELLVQCCRQFGILQEGATLTLLWLFVSHVVYMNKLPFRLRAQRSSPLPQNIADLIRDQFLPAVFSKLAALLPSSQASVDIDGRMFIALVGLATKTSFDESSLQQLVGPSAYAATQHIWELVGFPSTWSMETLASTTATMASHNVPPSDVSLAAPLLPFSHPVLNDILSSVQVVTQPDLPTQQAMYFDFSRQGVWFDDRFHWHVQKEILPVRGAALLSWKARKAKERFMNALQQQAETLTGASGLGLRRIAIVATSDKEKHKAASKVAAPHSKAKGKPLSKKELLLQKIADDKARERDGDNLAWLVQRLKELKTLSTHEKIKRVEQMRLNPRSQQSLWLGAELNLFMIHLTLTSWIEHPEQEDASTRDDFTVNIMQQVQALSMCGPFTSDRATAITTVLRALGLADYSATLVPVMDKDVGAPMTFKFLKLEKSSGPLFPWMKITEHPLRWQLRLFGPYMDRSMDAAYDKRVDFKPDGWQRQALDCIDDPYHSLLVVAPTSAGKTFISFYAMEKVLRHSDDSILVYIAPTKALVNQIAAEVYARYSKNLTNGALWAIHTRDYRINDPQNCQILVTVPEILAIMLLSPPLARKWTPRLKRIILDEIHTIGQDDGGSIWEQLILLAPCPIIGLSATVGSPEKFNAWLESIASAHKWKHSFIHYQHRYSHLRKFFYQSNVESRQLNGKNFDGLSSHSITDRLYFLHPISLLSFGERPLPNDLSLESRDTLLLYDAFANVYGQEVSELEPVSFFSLDRPAGQLLIQADVLRYESALKERFVDYMHKDPPGSKAVVRALEDPNIPRESKVDLLGGLLSLVADLHARGMLPAILFSFDRRGCEQIAKQLVTQLREAEKSWKAGNSKWQLGLQQWETWKETQKTRARTQGKANKARRKKENEEVREDAAESISWESFFDPDMPLMDFSFLGRASYQELEEEIRNLEWALAGDSWQMEALRRGIAVHHAGMNKHYRNLIENLYRRGIIRIMVSTGTLALGINAPAKSSVFCGDSPFLTALMYRQCAGRAGRRGYDLLGNVVFYALPMQRVQRMVLSRLPSLGGSFPLNTTMTLRLFNLLHGSQNAEVAVTAFQTLMNLPQITFGSAIGSAQLKHHLRFNIEYLRRTRLLTETGVPINLSSVVAHLYYHEPSNFAFVVLLHAGILHTISKEDDPEVEFIRLMSHLFGRRLLPSILCQGDHFERLRTRYPSRIKLDPLREDALKCLSVHEREVRDIFASYVSTYASQYASELPCDTILPLSKVSFGIPDTKLDDDELGELGQHLEASANHVQVRSLFVANSGHTDQFGSVDELAHSVRSGIHLNVNAIPNMGPYIKQGEHPLNAYLFDFYMHGQVQTLEKANEIRLGDVWFYLQDFMLVLMTVKTSIQQYLKQASNVGEEELEEDFQSDDDEEGDSGDDFPRPPGVSNADWQLYSVVRNACDEFEQKFKAIWA